MRAFILAGLVPCMLCRCPDLATLRSSAVKSSFSVDRLDGLWYENRYTDPAQIGASCQRMNKTGLASGNIKETYEVYYAKTPFPLPLIYNATTGVLGLFNRYMSLFPAASFPSVVVDFDAEANGTYSALVEYLCWNAPLNLTCKLSGDTWRARYFS
jgi:hypothetical protein